MRIIVILSILFSFSAQSSNDTIIDANFSRAEVFSGKIIPRKVIKNQRLIKIFYYGFDNKIHQGQLVCNYLFANQLKSIFDKLLKDKFPIYSVIPIHKFNWSDSESMKANNTSCFNFRKSQNGQRSEHVKGLALDINPLQNPYYSGNSKIYPKGASYNINEKGTIVKGSNIIKYFQKVGWGWGGNWKYSKDYQHFSSNGR